jgi:hypothetical protein
MDRIARIGVDLTKNVMQLHGVDAAERVVVRKAMSRGNENNASISVEYAKATLARIVVSNNLRELRSRSVCFNALLFTGSLHKFAKDYKVKQLEPEERKCLLSQYSY